MRLIGFALLLLGGGAIAADAAPTATVAGPLPVLHGVWIPATMKCSEAIRDVIFRYQPYAGEPACSAKYLKVGPSTYRSQKCSRNDVMATFVVKSPTLMAVDGELHHYCPPQSLDPVFRD